MTDGDDGMPEAGTAGDPAALTRQTAPSPLPGAPGRGVVAAPRNGLPHSRPADTVEVPEPWRRPRPVASTRSWPAPVTVTDARADSPSSTLTRDAPRPLSNGRPSAGGPSSSGADPPYPCARATATFSSPTGGSDTDYAVDATRPMNVAVHAGAGAAPGS